MQLYIFTSLFELFSIFLACSASPWTQGYLKYGNDNFVYLSPSKFWNSGLNREPNCNELKAMWRFSMAKSRSSEATNEIPTYQDPFVYNTWEIQEKTKHIENAPTRGRDFQGLQDHIYGKVIHTVPQENYSDRFKVYGRGLDNENYFDKSITTQGNNAEAFRLPNGAVSFRKLPALTDSFRRLKEVVRAQKAKEMHSSEVSLPHVDEREKARALGKRSFDFLYYGNSTFSSKRSFAPKSFHIVTYPSSLMYGLGNVYYIPPQYDGSNYGYYRITPYVTKKTKYRILPIGTQSY